MNGTLFEDEFFTAQEDSFPPAAHARRGDRATSHEAAAEVTPRLTDNQQMVLKVIQERFGDVPFTDVDLVTAYQLSWENREGLGLMLQSQSGIRTRRSELTTQGHVVDTGKTRRIGKRKHTLWRLR